MTVATGGTDARTSATVDARTGATVKKNDDKGWLGNTWGWGNWGFNGLKGWNGWF